MRRLLGLAVLLSGGTGCLSLDFMFTDTAQVDAYDLDPTLVPPELTELVSFERDDGVVLQGAWARQPEPAPPLIYFHGNGSNLETDWHRVATYWGWGRHDVFIADYAGFGASEGEASWDSLANHDGHAIAAYVAEASGYPAEQIPWVALSLGGFVAIHANDEVPAQALVLESVFADADALVDDSLQMDLPNGWFFEQDWDNVDAIPDITSPVLVIHGLADDYIPAEAGERLYEAAPEPKELWQPEGVDHADLPEVDPEGYEQRALDWIDAHAP